MTEPNIAELKNVTPLEAFALASACAAIIAQGNDEITSFITSLAESIHDQIAGAGDAAN